MTMHNNLPIAKRILVPIDFSPSSDYAFDYARSIAAALDAHLDVVHVYQPPVYAMPEGVVFSTSAMDAEISTALLAELNKWNAERAQGGPPLSSQLIRGLPVEEICRYAQANDIDLIIMGTNGRSGFSRLLVGSVAERVVRTSPIPVLTVRKPESA